MTLRNPEWLALLPLLLAAGWWLPALRLGRPLRLLLLGLLCLLLARPQWRHMADGVDLWVLTDRSASTEKAMARGMMEREKLLEQSRGRSDRLFILDYAEEVLRRGAEGAELHERLRQSTRTNLAVTQALLYAKRESEGRQSRVLVLSDGYSTEPLTGMAEKLRQQGVELDYHLTRDVEVTDYRVAALRTPVKAQLGEPFMLEIEVRGTQDGRVPLKVLRQGREIRTTHVDVKMGAGLLRMTDRLTTAGVGRYEVIIQPLVDAHPGNNRHEAVIEIAGGPRVLLLTAYTDDPVRETLQRQGFTVETVTALQSVRAEQLTGAKCVIFNNVPAFEFPGDFLAAVDFFVREQGGGLLMVGGQKSFAAGGYFESPLDSLLPVSMELKQEHRKLMLAMAIVMDRSGSMSMTVKNGFTKMALADEGAANAIRFLGPQDLLTVLAVDSEAHVMVPLKPVGPNRQKMESAVRRIESMGGGIFVYVGLEAAWKQLKAAPVGQRHIILFSDAADSEEPGDYKKLVAEIVAGGGSLSAIALGTRADPDAKLLEELATLGKGRLFFTDKAEELPSIFSQETVAVARSAFIKEPVKTKAAGGWFEITGKPLSWMPEVDGYNLSYLRDWASQGLIAQDEHNAPLVAFGQRGIGRSAAVSFPLGGPFSENVRAWPGYGDFVQTLTRWLMGEQLPPGIGLKHKVEGTVLTLDLLHDEEWEPRLAARPPRILLAQDADGGPPREVAWERLSPGHYRARADLPEGTAVRGAVQVGSQALPFGPTVVGGRMEWAFDEARTEELRQASLASGGRELRELGQAWRSTQMDRWTDLQLELLVLALVIMLLETLVTRTGWHLPEWGLFPLKKIPLGKLRTKPAAHVTGPPSPEKTTAATDPPPPAETAPPPDRQNRYNRAKRR